MSFDDRQLRDALGLFGTGVCLVTVANARGGGHALTVNSFAAVSLDPPLVLWSLQRSSDAFDLYAQAAHCAVAVLGADQEDLSGRYARKGNHALDGAHYRLADNGAPLVRDALVNFECSLERSLDGGDHLIQLLRVTRLHRGSSAAPLLFFGGAYRRLA